MTVLILGSMDDEHACYMLEHLRASGHDTELLDSAWFPSDLRITFHPETGSGSIVLPTDRELALEQIESVYWRCYNYVGSQELPDPEQSYIASNDSRGLFESLLIRLPAKWVNGWNAYQLHQTKPAQLAMIAALGIRIPHSVLTNDPQSVQAFAAKTSPSIFKPVQGGAHTRRVLEAHLTPENLQHLSLAPVTLQEEIVGTDIRVFVAGERVVACELRTSAVDFRDDPDPDIRPHSLTDDMEATAIRAARALNLLWTGMDFRLTPDGQYIFLEANPSPMFMGFEERSGLPLTDCLTALLTEP